MLDDSMTLVSWRARPRSFVALMGLYESNYVRLGWLAGDLASLGGTQRSSAPGECDLVLRVSEHCPYTTSASLTYLFPSEPAEFPDMRLRIYHDARVVEAQEWASSHPHPVLRMLHGRAERELDQRWARNVMLNKWLEYCLERGHRFSSATDRPAAP
jgi:uncharacterized protein YqiB (DUF1249 family)